MVLANRYFKDFRSTQALIFSPNTVFHSLHYSHKSLRYFCFLQFFISVRPHHFYMSLKSSNRPDNRFPWGNYHHISFIRVIRSCALTMLIQKMSKMSFAFTENCFATVLSEPWASHYDCKPEHTEMACVSSWMSRKETSTKKLDFHKEKDWLDAVVTAENLSYVFLMQMLQINWFSMAKLGEARSERERPIHHDPDSTTRRKVTRNKQVKFVSLLDVFFICLFQLYLSLVIEAFRISTNL